MVALFVALMFVGFLLVDVMVQRVQQRNVPAHLEPGWTIPSGVYLAEGHSWSRPDSSSGVRLGVDALVAHAVGAVEKVVLPGLGQLVKAGEPLFRLERQGRGFNILSSITGQVVALNNRVVKRPESVSKDPYGSGWICAITPTESDGGFGRMRCGQTAALWLEREFHRFREFLTMQVTPDINLAVTYPDGGLPRVGSLAELPVSGWLAFEAAFLAAGSVGTQASQTVKE